ncbi:MAG: ABC transporter ATP-binding protein [Thermoplasmata archaeon]
MFLSLSRVLSLLFAAVAVGAALLTLLDQLYATRFEIFDLFYDGRGQELLITTLVGILALVFLLLSQVASLREELEARRRDELVNHSTPGAGGLVVAPLDGEPILKAEGIRKVYDTGRVQVEALRGIDLEVKRGEMIVIMGPSGSGKTTLLNVLSGLDDLSGGSVFIRGLLLSDLTDRDRTDYRAAKMGFVFQSYNLIPVLTAVENVEIPLLILGVGAKEARQQALQALAAVGLEGEGGRRPLELSGGQQQRVAIARAVVNDPEVVFADEPTGNLDAETSEEVVALLSELNKTHGLTLVVVTHDPAVTEYADRLLTIRDGAIAEERTLQEA